jgi:transposase
MATLRKSVSRGHTYWQIVESRRVNGKPRPIVLEHLGTAEALLRRLREGPGKPVKVKSIRFGAEAALWRIAEELEVVGTIDRHVPKRDQGLSCGQYMLLAAINRCVAATSKASLYDWYRKTALHRLMPASKRLLSSQRFWDHMGYLDEDRIAAIEEELATRIVRKFSHVYPGNENDAKMFASVTESLAARYRQMADECEEITLVFDGGNTSEKNIADIDETEYHFITSLTTTHHEDLLKIPLSRFDSFSDPKLVETIAFRTKKQVWGKERTVVVTFSFNKKRAALHELRSKLRRSQEPGARGKGYTPESLQKRLDAICKGQYVSKILKTKIVNSRGHLDFTFKTDQQAFQRLIRNRLGRRILCTDNDEWSTEEIILGSRAQFHVENAFKKMKDPHWVKFSPAFHWTDQKLRVHAFYCVLALTLASLMHRKAAHAGVTLSMPRLFDALSDIREIVNLYGALSSSATRGRFQAEYHLELPDPIHEELAQIFDLPSLSHP